MTQRDDIVGPSGKVTLTPLTPAWYREPWPWILMAGPAAVALSRRNG